MKQTPGLDQALGLRAMLWPIALPLLFAGPVVHAGKVLPG